MISYFDIYHKVTFWNLSLRITSKKITNETVSLAQLENYITYIKHQHF